MGCFVSCCQFVLGMPYFLYLEYCLIVLVASMSSFMGKLDVMTINCISCKLQERELNVDWF